MDGVALATYSAAHAFESLRRRPPAALIVGLIMRIISVSACVCSDYAHLRRYVATINAFFSWLRAKTPPGFAQNARGGGDPRNRGRHCCIQPPYHLPAFYAGYFAPFFAPHPHLRHLRRIVSALLPLLHLRAFAYSHSAFAYLYVFCVFFACIIARNVLYFLQVVFLAVLNAVLKWAILFCARLYR